MFSAYANFVDTCMRRNADLLARLNLERDEAKDLRDDLWALEDAYKLDDGFEDANIDEDS